MMITEAVCTCVGWEGELPELCGPSPQPLQVGAPVLIQVPDNEPHPMNPMNPVTSAAADAVSGSMLPLLKRLDETLDRTNDLLEQNTHALQMLAAGKTPTGGRELGVRPSAGGNLHSMPHRSIIRESHMDLRRGTVAQVYSSSDLSSYQHKEYLEQVSMDCPQMCY